MKKPQNLSSKSGNDDQSLKDLAISFLEYLKINLISEDTSGVQEEDDLDDGENNMFIPQINW